MDDKTLGFDPNGVGVKSGNFFSLPFDIDSSKVVILSAPWDVTVSYGAGTSYAPRALLEASSQIDLYDSFAPEAWREGIATLPISELIHRLSTRLRPVAERVIEYQEEGLDLESDAEILELLESVNRGSEELNGYIYRQCRELISSDKIVALVGGDHSVIYGAVKAVAESYAGFGVLHIDAHRDLRECYEGFQHSHASALYNILEDFEQVERVVQVGVRDFCVEEQSYADESGGRVVSFTDMELARGRFEGERWRDQVCRIVDALPQQIYVTLDIDGLEMGCCPHTGTPVPGGLGYNELVYLLEVLVESGREIIGFDLVEVAPSGSDTTDLAVGVRLLYKLCCLAIKSNLFEDI